MHHCLHYKVNSHKSIIYLKINLIILFQQNFLIYFIIYLSFNKYKSLIHFFYLLFIKFLHLINQALIQNYKQS